jgi:hypothetical protein
LLSLIQLLQIPGVGFRNFTSGRDSLRGHG